MSSARYPEATTADAGAHSAARALVRSLERAHALHAGRAADPGVARALARLSDWQSRRLAATYADLASEPRYRDAIAFFQSDLYGPQDFSRRDADLSRVVPAMTRLLPERVVETVARAMELSALSHELDAAMLAHLPSGDGAFGVDDYCRALRRTGREGDRRRQVALIVDVGEALDRYVKKPLIRSALTMMRKPARLAGLDELQTFLERGFSAFHRMGGAAEFLATIRERESALLVATFAGAESPFSEPPRAEPAPPA